MKNTGETHAPKSSSRRKLEEIMKIYKEELFHCVDHNNVSPTDTMLSMDTLNIIFNLNIKIVNAECKLLYLKICMDNQIIPNHLLSHIINLENCFNKNYLNNTKQNNFFNILGNKVLNLDKKQAYWLIRTNKKKLQAHLDKINSIDNNSYTQIYNICKKWNNLLKDNKLINIKLKVNKPNKSTFRNPYDNNVIANKHCTTIFSNNLRNNDKSIKRYFNVFYYYDNLHKYNRVINLTTKIIPNNIINLLSLGDNFNYEPYNKKINIFQMLADIESIIINLDTPETHKNGLRNTINKNILNYLNREKNRPNDTINKFNKIINNDLRNTKFFFKNNKDICIIKSDKTKQLVIMTKNDYQQKILDIINDKQTYKSIRNNPMIELNNKVNKYIEKLIKYKFIDKNYRNKLSNNFFNNPRIHGLIKMHKKNYPLRPIVDGTNNPTDNLAKFLNGALDNLNKENEFDIKNAIELKDKLKQIKLQPDQIIASLDIVSMFPNIPLKLAIKLINDNWEKIEPYTCIKSKTIFIEGIKLCTENGYFTFQNKFYKQITGLPMGGRLSVNISGIVINHIIKESLLKMNNPPIFIVKYIDDLLVITNNNILVEFNKILNEQNKNIVFTLETETENSINFLDITIIREPTNNYLTTKWFKKDITSNRLLNYYSNHPIAQIKNVATNLIGRSIKLTDAKFLKETKNKIFKILLSNAFPISLINKLWYTQYKIINNNDNNSISKNVNINFNTNKNIKDSKKLIHSNYNKKTKPNQSKITNYFKTEDNNTNTQTKNSIAKISTESLNVEFKQDKTKTNYRSITYIRNLSNKIEPTFKNYDIHEIKVAHNTKNPIRKIIESQKDKIPILDNKNVVYDIECNNCNKRYIGHTKNSLNSRFYHHKNNIKPNSKTGTALSAHCKETLHTFNFENPKVLHKEKNTIKRKCLEALCINDNIENVVNDRKEAGDISKLYSSVILKLKKK